MQTAHLLNQSDKVTRPHLYSINACPRLFLRQLPLSACSTLVLQCPVQPSTPQSAPLTCTLNPCASYNQCLSSVFT